MKRISTLTIIILFGSSSLFCGNIGFIGAGARSSGMGGAFVAIADDATSIFWNPAGLTHLLEKEVSIVGRFDNSIWDFPSSLAVLTPNTAGSFSLNFASFAYPTKIFKRNFTAALSIASIYDFNFNDKIFRVDPGGTVNINYLIEEEAKGKLYQISSGFAYEILPDVSFGTAFNWHYGRINGVNKNGKNILTGDATLKVTENDTLKGGSSISFGVFANLPYKWHIGGVAKIKIDDMEWNGEKETTNLDPKVWTDDDYINRKSGSSNKNSFPNSFGLGVSFTPSDYIIVAADYSIIKWSQYKIDGWEPVYESSGVKKFVDANQVHIGFEYLLPRSFINEYPMPIRLGVYTDPFPIQYENKTGISATFFTIGSGLVLDFGQIDLSIEYGTRDWGFSRSENIFRLISSIIVKT